MRERREESLSWLSPSQSLPVHSQSLPVHSQSLPVHSQSLPVHSQSLPVHSQSLPVHSQSLPVHSLSWLSPSQSLPVHSQSLPVHSQSRRWRRSQSAPSRGCHLGTCQLQNLASLLYRIGNKNGKEESNRNTADPRGYGKRRRRRRREERR
ncbi:UNVERIFIED_CONTAM: hypothetical protein FKN15_066283 [Acipenser sinensis]